MFEKWDTEITVSILSALAVSKGHIALADVISKMDDEDLIKEFLTTY